MAKRVADTYLTDRNFDHDDAVTEKPGTFAAASRNVLSTREIKKARRRGVGNDSGSSPSTGAFKGFTGFSGVGSGYHAFGFGFSSLTSPGSKPITSMPSSTSVPSCSTVATTTSKSPGFGFGFTAAKPPADNGVTPTVTSISTESPSSDALPAAYVQSVKCLNESLLRWIDQHVRSNPRCILSPVFRDYDTHLDHLNKTFNVAPDRFSGASQAASTSGPPPAASTSTAVTESTSMTPAITSITGTGATVSTPSVSVAFNGSAAYAAPGFFATTTSPKTAAAAATQPSPLFSFSTSSTTTSSAATSALGGTTFQSSFGTNPAAGFTFGTGGFQFGGSVTQPSAAATAEQPSSGNANAAEDEEEYVPPKPESVEIKEDDAFYTIRCKLYYMLNNDWKERGVGHLYLKPCSGDKTQLLVRSDTTLGNILLNISLTKNIPTSLQGKSSVSLSCIPNPPIDSKQKDVKPVCMLIRVKTAEDAAELLKQLNDNKK